MRGANPLFGNMRLSRNAGRCLLSFDVAASLFAEPLQGASEATLQVLRNPC